MPILSIVPSPKMSNFDFETETNPVSNVPNVPCWPFALPEPPVPHPSELEFSSSMQFSPPPFSSSLYFLPTTPKHLISTPLASTLPSPLDLFLHTPQSISTTTNSVDPPLSPHPPAVPVPTLSTAPSPNPHPEYTPSKSAHAHLDTVYSSPPQSPFCSPFASPTTSTPSLPYPFPTLGHSTLPTTHATRNPHLSVQESHAHPRISGAQKATKVLQAKATREKHVLLSEAIQELQEKHEWEFGALARAHLVTPEYINKLIATRHFKMKRDVSLENAKIHAKSIEVNAGV